jgi:CDP-6-deoxy-D-xylo-4-hexulose-3-dehydrase
MITVQPNARFHRDELVGTWSRRRIQTRMLFGGQPLRQPALTELIADRAARGYPAPVRVVGALPQTERVMRDGFWLGVYPGLSEEALGYMAEQLRRFIVGGER